MSCNICQTKFSFFTKENGCPSCGFSYCSKCLKYKFNLPNIGEKKICGRCYNKLQASVKPPIPADDCPISDKPDEPMAPIDITKRLESLENPGRPPIVMYKQSTKLDNLRAGLDPVDHEIINRLKKLKDEDKQASLPSEDEIRRRLAILKDQDPDVVNQPINVQQVDVRTNQQKTDDLIQEYIQRLHIAKSVERTDSDIQSRLDNLKGVDSSKYANQNIADAEVEDDETSMKKIIEKAMAEAALEKKYGEVDELQDVDSERSPKRDDEHLTEDSENSCDDEDMNGCDFCDRPADCKTRIGNSYCSACFVEHYGELDQRRREI